MYTHIDVEGHRWCMHVIPTLRTQRQEDCELELRLGYIMRSCLNPLPPKKEHIIYCSSYFQRKNYQFYVCVLLLLLRRGLVIMTRLIYNLWIQVILLPSPPE
jgi:hypothetical protein